LRKMLLNFLSGSSDGRETVIDSHISTHRHSSWWWILSEWVKTRQKKMLCSLQTLVWFSRDRRDGGINPNAITFCGIIILSPLGPNY
jgi:hypothetical protein